MKLSTPPERPSEEIDLPGMCGKSLQGTPILLLLKVMHSHCGRKAHIVGHLVCNKRPL
jgi:hypothetical protein